MNCIIQMVHNSIMGSVIDALEYWAVANLYKPVFLVLVQTPQYGILNYKDYLLQVFEDRYCIKPNSDMIVVLNKLDLLKHKFNNVVILDYGTIPHIRGILRANQVLIVSEDTQEKYWLDKVKYNAMYYGEMPFVYKDYDYRMKLAFDLFKPIGVSAECIYINCPKNRHNDEMLKYVLKKEKAFFFKAPKHQMNLFEAFDEYIYWHSDYFDTHPRLMLECKFYDKKIEYINSDNILDGSYYRYKDLLKNGLDNRNLNRDDEVIQFLI